MLLIIFTRPSSFTLFQLQSPHDGKYGKLPHRTDVQMNTTNTKYKIKHFSGKSDNHRLEILRIRTMAAVKDRAELSQPVELPNRAGRYMDCQTPDHSSDLLLHPHHLSTWLIHYVHLLF